ncbi:hypothetical protein DFH05DRAFT_1480055 [Lentinula detonsa]|uniref:Secreted protein n=1 Tax=Lentinula detonsa TaxID=2804962 RepID=A0A9W8P608_9AGAR|nr:hypothetical protein DFH05DRAFT_1480055 [Lentinula detonsa]
MYAALASFCPLLPLPLSDSECVPGFLPGETCTLNKYRRNGCGIVTYSFSKLTYTTLVSAWEYVVFLAPYCRPFEYTR